MSDTMTPSQRIIAEASAPIVLTDALGRKLTVRKLTALDQLKLYRAIGAEHSANQPVFYMSSAAAAVSHIEGLYLPFPKNEAAIDDRIKRLGDEGMAAVQAWQMSEIRQVMEAAKAAMDAAEASGEEASAADPLAASAAS